ncbi:hypothetical protein ACFLZ8_03950, partial [Planctomycetota bacterium]
RKKHDIEDFSPAVITGEITGKPIRIKVIAAFLRIADACHVDRSRVPGKLRALYDSLGMQPEEVCHWGQPQLISKVRFNHQAGKIIIESLIPNPIDFKQGKFDFEEIIELVRKDLAEELRSVQTVILPYTNTAFKEVTKEVNVLPALDVEAPQRCLGIWPYFLRKPFSATKGVASLAQMLLFEIAETKNFGKAWQQRIRGMIQEAVRWRPYDVIVFQLHKEINNILLQKNPALPINESLKLYLREFLEKICTNSNRINEMAIPLVISEDVFFLYGYSINIVKFLVAIGRSHTVYVIDCRSSYENLQFDPHEDEQMIEILEKNNFNVQIIRLTGLSQILDDFVCTKTPTKIILGAHSVLRQSNNNYSLLCKKGSKDLSLIGREGGAEIMAFVETNKFFNVENEEDVKSVANYGFSYNQENSSIEIAREQERPATRMDIISKSLIDYLITEEKIYPKNQLPELKKV